MAHTSPLRMTRDDRWICAQCVLMLILLGAASAFMAVVGWWVMEAPTFWGIGIFMLCVGTFLSVACGASAAWIGSEVARGRWS